MKDSTLPNKSVILTSAVLLCAMMVAASPMLSLVPTTAFAEKQPSQDTQRNVASASQRDTSQNNGGKGAVTVDPIIQTSVQPGVNVGVNTHVITDKESCKEANDKVHQANVQSSNQQASRNGKVGEGGTYVGPTVQTATQVGINVYVNVDVILAKGCTPHDEVHQANVQSSNQQASNDLKGGEGSRIIIPTYQTSNNVEKNIAVDEHVYSPVPLPQ